MAVNNIRLSTVICMMILVASTTIQGKSTGLPPARDSTEAVTSPPTATESDQSGLSIRTSNPVVSNNSTTEEQEFNSNNTENNSWSNSNNTGDNSWTNSNKNSNNSWWNGNNAGNSSNVCSSRPCYNGGWCQRVWYSFWCLCPPGYWGRQCESSNPCASNPCQNWGTCSVPWYNPSMFTCACAPGYTGTTCQIKTFANWFQWSKK